MQGRDVRKEGRKEGRGGAYERKDATKECRKEGI
jgi:hypothetical protein